LGVSDIFEELIIRKSHRLPALDGPAGDGAVAARQFDAVLMKAGWKLSRELLEHLSGKSTGVVMDAAIRILPVVRGIVGDHVRHNTYFMNFPEGVPDTIEFWTECLAEALLDPSVIEQGGVDVLVAGGGLNLLALPSYGRYLHSYEEMLAAHDDLIPAAGDRVTVLHLGAPLEAESSALYVSLASSRVPLSEDDLGVLELLAEHCAAGPQPELIPVRENRALINKVRLAAGAELLVDTVTDVLRLVCALSGGDVTLREPTRFLPLPRRTRRALLAALDQVVDGSRAKLGDVHAHREPWKRLGERLHPHEYPQWPQAAAVFKVACGELAAASFGSRLEAALSEQDVPGAVALLQSAPGLLFRSLDRLLRTATSAKDQAVILEAVEATIAQVSGRVILQVREHLQNRARPEAGGRRAFVNKEGRAWVAVDSRPVLGRALLSRLFAILDADLQRRLPPLGHLLVDPAVFGVAVPLSGKATATGFGVLPRGSVSPVNGEVLRFFTYWRETEQTTDFDLSALMLDKSYGNASWLSYTNLRTGGGEHSGDITSAPDGATEFINLRLGQIKQDVVIPHVLVYSGEGYEEVAESFFGFMTMSEAQRGAPFEPSTVRMKSDLRGAGRIALPIAFVRGPGGTWAATWLHLFMKGRTAFNMVEENRATTSQLVRGIVERDYLRMDYLTTLMGANAETVSMYDGGSLPEEPVTFVGLERPEGLAEGSQAFTLNNLRDLIPA
jgi:hypothetical protein